VLLRIVFMAHSAAVMTDATLRTLYRVAISRKHLLEWRSAAAVGSDKVRTIGDYIRDMSWAVGIGFAGLALAAAADTGAMAVAGPVAGLWIASPLVAWWVSRSAETEDRLEVSPADSEALRQVGRRTWSYFERFVTSEHNGLPPDNFQEDPEPVVAARTSPTNIGLYLLSVISARDFGWIGTAEAVERLEKAMDAVDRLERLHGHLYNWNDTRSLTPLAPKYVSTVDSGNLAGHLVAASAACGAWASDPGALSDRGFEGISDVAHILAAELSSVPDDRRALRALRHRIDDLSGIPWWVFLVQGRYKYIRTLVEGEIEELYDLENDPEELTNLALMPKFADTVLQFRQATVQELTRTDAGMVQHLPAVKN
jgi:cyclic beta-1,2-glucan synthetase